MNVSTTTINDLDEVQQPRSMDAIVAQLRAVRIATEAIDALNHMDTFESAVDKAVISAAREVLVRAWDGHKG